jgi:8-oxo-dGTP diphosphatase
MNALRLLVSVVVFRLHEETLQALLCPVPSGWLVPLTDVNARESLEETAQRLLASLVNRRPSYLEQLYTYYDPPQEDNQATVRVTYYALMPVHADVRTADSGCWHPVQALPTLPPLCCETLTYALRRLRYKLEYSAVGFQLLPEEFTLSELQHTYEIILGEQLDKRNFRRRILQAGIIEETARFRYGEGRPARLYRYRPDAVAEVKARRLFP